jgi:hypothetical protein
LIEAGTFMIWIVAVALAVWVLAQQSRVGRLERRIDVLSRALAELTHRPAVPDESPWTAPVTVAVPAAEAEVTPVTVAVPLTVRRLAAATAGPRIETPAEPETLTPPRPAAKRREGPNLAAWLSENGLAWPGWAAAPWPWAASSW